MVCARICFFLARCFARATDYTAPESGAERADIEAVRSIKYYGLEPVMRRRGRLLAEVSQVRAAVTAQSRRPP